MARTGIEQRRNGPVVELHIDDGARNVFAGPLVMALFAALDAARADPTVGCVLLTANDTALSVGLDTATVRAGGEDGRALLDVMGRVLRLLYTSRLRVVAVARGHGTAAGAMLLLVADHRIGVRGPGRIGLSEVRFGLAVPEATRQLVRDRLAVPARYAATALAKLHDPGSARAVGYLDELTDEADAALRRGRERAAELASLDEVAYLETKLAMRRGYVELAAGR